MDIHEVIADEIVNLLPDKPYQLVYLKVESRKDSYLIHGYFKRI